MRIQIIELPSQSLGEGYESPYILVLSEVTSPPQALASMTKGAFEHCAGVIATDEAVQIGPKSLYELQREAEPVTDPQMTVETLWRRIPGWTDGDTQKARQFVECPEQNAGRGCACSLGAQDCPVNGRIPASIGVMDIPPEDRSVSVTQNSGGTRVVHVAIDGDQTPEELASDVAAIVEEQRESRQVAGTDCGGRESCEVMCCKDDPDESVAEYIARRAAASLD